MTIEDVRNLVVRIIADRFGWPADEASKIVGDISDLIDDGLSAAEIGDATISELRAEMP